MAQQVEHGSTAPLGSSLLVRDVLDEPTLGLRLVSGADGLDRAVRWAHSTELLHPEPYLRGDEIVLTVGSSLRSSEKCRSFARVVARGGAAAIGYGTGDVTTDVPAALADECERLGLALLEVPVTVPFIAVTEWLAALRSIASVREHERAEIGRLLDLVRLGLAAPHALDDRLAEAGLADASEMVVVAYPEERNPPWDVPPGSRALIGAAPGRVGYVVTVPADEAAFTGDVPCGVSEPCTTDQVHTALAESAECLRLATERGRVVVRPPELATFDGLLARLSDDQLRPFVAHIARPLLDHDARYGTELMTTLRVFLRNNGSVSATSKELYLHANSLRNRLSRIAGITDRDPLVFTDRVALAVSVSVPVSVSAPAPVSPRPRGV